MIPVMKKQILLLLVILAVAGCKKDQKDASATAEVTPAEAREIAKEAWIYGYSIFYNYKTQYEYALDKNSATTAGGFNKFKHYDTSFTYKDTTIVTPNNDTPYSWAMLNLTDEPVILQVPKIEGKRYYVMQLIDLYTFNFAYVGSRATGNEPGNYLIAGPNWKGEAPAGITKTFQSETNLVTLLGRTEMDSPAEQAIVRKIQAGYKIIPLHEFTKQPKPAAMNYVMPLPVWNEADYTSPNFINVLNALLQYTVADSSEKELHERFAKIGLVPGQPFDQSKYSPEVLKAIEEGIADGGKALKESIGRTTSSLELFGTRADLKNDYMKRAVAAAMGIYGNTKEEAVYVGTMADDDQKPLMGENKYIVRFTKDQLPKVEFFWSITMYNLPKRHLVQNPIDRYSIGDRTKGIKYEPNGDLIIYLQATSPGKDKESNWLPSPAAGPFNIIVRMYGPDQSVTSGQWQMPLPEKVN
jgi:hypothetical protein